MSPEEASGSNSDIRARRLKNVRSHHRPERAVETTKNCRIISAPQGESRAKAVDLSAVHQKASRKQKWLRQSKELCHLKNLQVDRSSQKAAMQRQQIDFFAPVEKASSQQSREALEAFMALEKARKAVSKFIRII